MKTSFKVLDYEVSKNFILLSKLFQRMLTFERKYNKESKSMRNETRRSCISLITRKVIVTLPNRGATESVSSASIR
jgi:hypothetical protein